MRSSQCVARSGFAPIVNLAIDGTAHCWLVSGSAKTQRSPVRPNQNVGTNVGSNFGNLRFIVQKQQDKPLDW